MSEMCYLCKSPINNMCYTNYSLILTSTKYSKKVLCIYLTEVCKGRILVTDTSAVCADCKSLIDELDCAERLYREKRDRIWSYLSFSDKKCDVYCQTASFDVEEKQFGCTECMETFLSEQELDSHLKEFHSELQEIIKKEEFAVDNVYDVNIEIANADEEEVGHSMCPQKKNVKEVNSQLLSQNNQQPFICEVCGQSYKQKSALHIHIGMHNGINPFTCQYCQKSFTQKVALQRHLPIHTGDTPYQCDTCGKRFVHHTSFNMHQLSHTGQKEYKCLQCGLALLSASHLTRHMRVHTGEKKYACTLCDKRFAERYNLTSHQKLHQKTSDSTFKRNHRCMLCHQNFNRKLKLEEHMVQEHHISIKSE
ncbi:hypothetical protein FQA39_LY16072 [Lamprigera yunnana]|nr:hypothetical protein FQA39_LY16072 [Lamprigera yunnana]